MRLKNLIKNLLEQIKSLKDDEKNTKDKINNSKNEEFLHLRNHHQNILTQVKKLKSVKKLLNVKLEKFTQEEVSKSLVHVEEKNTNPDLVNIPTQEKDKLDGVNMYSKVAIPATKDSSEDP